VRSNFNFIISIVTINDIKNLAKIIVIEIQANWLILVNNYSFDYF